MQVLPSSGTPATRHNGGMSPAAVPTADSSLLVGGILRAEPADFCVDEVPSYAPCGSGEHLFLHVEKTSLNTTTMMERIARALGVQPREVGHAGLKDRHAVTKQWISLPRATAEAALSMNLPGIRVLSAIRHGNKLRIGHLLGNRFDILVRGVSPDAALQVHLALQRLMAEGLPNRHGAQRYGARGDNALIGAALVRNDSAALVELLGTPVRGVESPRIIEARTAFAARDAARALDLFPREFDLERHFATAWLRGQSAEQAMPNLPRQSAQFLMNAWQSALFDAVLQARLARGMALLRGDVAMKLANGASFVVQDVALETPRREAFEIVPTGPLPGAKLLRPEHDARAVEDDALRAAGCDPDALEVLPLTGARRALLVRVQDAEACADAAGVRLRFMLPAGSFATTLLAEFGVAERRGATA